MNVICNDCVGGELYKLYNEKYQNPFIWTILPFKDFLNLYKNYENINFNNVEYNETPNYMFPWYMSSLIIDGKVNLYFPHHARYEEYNELVKLQVGNTQNVYAWSHIDEYLIEHYKRRVLRMVDEPVFVYSEENRNTEEQIKELLEEAKTSKKKLILITSNEKYEKEYNKYDNIKFIYKTQNEVVQKTQAEWIKNKLDFFIKS